MERVADDVVGSTAFADWRIGPAAPCRPASVGRREVRIKPVAVALAQASVAAAAAVVNEGGAGNAKELVAVAAAAVVENSSAVAADRIAAAAAVGAEVGSAVAEQVTCDWEPTDSSASARIRAESQKLVA